MWKAAAGHNVDNNGGNGSEDDWETDPDFVNDVSEQEQRWGSKTIQGSGRTAGAIDMTKLREETEKSDADKKKKLLEEQNAGYGYGGKFGLEKDRMDKSAVGNDYVGKVEKHSSQKDYASGFGGKFGVQSDRVDKSAVGWDHIEKVEKHESQVDHKTGFGGKFGVQTDRVDKSAVGWDHIEKVEKHESQVDHKTGFGGKFGVQSDRMDKSAVGFQDGGAKVGTAYTKTKPDICGAKPSSLRARFENFSQVSDADAATRAAEQKRIREEKDRLDRERAQKDEKAVNAQDDRPAQQQRKGAIETGREGGIGSAINRFNQPKEETEVSPVKKQPIEIPRGAPLIVENNPVPSDVVVPDVVQQTEPQRPVSVKKEKEPEPEPQPVHVPVATPAAAAKEEVEEEAFYEDVAPSEVEPVKSHQEVAANVTAAEEPQQPVSGQFQSLPPNEDLSDYIEDTGVKATALYDYQAAAEDEISFDPEDLITHIEMIDEGWWRGLCKNKYGLFPANYVQLLQ